jgi:hypothetical protein
MKGDPGKMSCAEFQDQMAELIGSGADLSKDPHLESCENCRKLLAELQTIADAARQLLAPSVEPSDDLWKNIESKIKQEEDEDPQPGLAPPA